MLIKFEDTIKVTLNLWHYSIKKFKIKLDLIKMYYFFFDNKKKSIFLDKNSISSK